MIFISFSIFLSYCWLRNITSPCQIWRFGRIKLTFCTTLVLTRLSIAVFSPVASGLSMDLSFADQSVDWILFDVTGFTFVNDSEDINKSFEFPAASWMLTIPTGSSELLLSSDATVFLPVMNPNPWWHYSLGNSFLSWPVLLLSFWTTNQAWVMVNTDLEKLSALVVSLWSIPDASPPSRRASEIASFTLSIKLFMVWTIVLNELLSHTSV